ncbi:MAG: O-antigen ligase family protein [Lachnospiraceae bacterium]|nr:O-antigen ligase family protein [Lachnospiraceae bacterium]
MQKLKENKDILIFILFAYMILTSYVSQTLYAYVTGASTLVFFVVLCVLFLLTVNLPQRLKKPDWELYIAGAAIVIAGLNLIIIGSNKGAVLVVADMALMLYLCDKITLSDRIKRLLGVVGVAVMIPWYAYVHWYYNFNMAGFIFITILIMGELLLEYIKNDYEFYYLQYVQILLYVVTILFTFCYHARGAMVCVILAGIIYLLLPLIARGKLYTLLVLLSTVFSIAFTGLYIAMGKLGVNFRVLYKDVLSGRQEIWGELWEAFLKQPLTGIGSSYELKSLFIFEVHNGLFDILTVHGVIVFILICILLIRKMCETGKTQFKFYPDKRLAAAGIFCFLFASFFENCFIVPPYSVIVFVLLLYVLDGSSYVN